MKAFGVCLSLFFILGTTTARAALFTGLQLPMEKAEVTELDEAGHEGDSKNVMVEYRTNGISTASSFTLANQSFEVVSTTVDPVCNDIFYVALNKQFPTETLEVTDHRKNECHTYNEYIWEARVIPPTGETGTERLYQGNPEPLNTVQNGGKF